MRLDRRGRAASAPAVPGLGGRAGGAVPAFDAAPRAGDGPWGGAPALPRTGGCAAGGRASRGFPPGPGPCAVLRGGRSSPGLGCPPWLRSPPRVRSPCGAGSVPCRPGRGRSRSSRAAPCRRSTGAPACPRSGQDPGRPRAVGPGRACAGRDGAGPRGSPPWRRGASPCAGPRRVVSPCGGPRRGASPEPCPWRASFGGRPRRSSWRGRSWPGPVRRGSPCGRVRPGSPWPCAPARCGSRGSVRPRPVGFAGPRRSRARLVRRGPAVARLGRRARRAALLAARGVLSLRAVPGGRTILRARRTPGMRRAGPPRPRLVRSPTLRVASGAAGRRIARRTAALRFVARARVIVARRRGTPGRAPPRLRPGSAAAASVRPAAAAGGARHRPWPARASSSVSGSPCRGRLEHGAPAPPAARAKTQPPEGASVAGTTDAVPGRACACACAGPAPTPAPTPTPNSSCSACGTGLAERVGVVVRAALDEHEALRLAGALRTARGRAPAGSAGPSLPCTTSTGEPTSAIFAPASKRCVISGASGSQPQRMLLDHVGDRREAALDDQPGLVVDLGRQVDRDRAAERMAEDVARPRPGAARPASRQAARASS